MSSLNPNTQSVSVQSIESESGLFSLSKAKYVEEKREILLEFSNSIGKVSKRFPFFPQLLTQVFDENVLNSILSQIDSKKFEIEKSPDFIKFTAATFSDLKNLAKLLSATIKSDFSVIEPERQFLLSNGWSYFDSFKILEKDFEKSGNQFVVPKAKLEIFSESIDKTLIELFESDSRNAILLIESMALSNILCLPLVQLPESLNEAVQVFFENSFFKNRLVLPKKNFGQFRHFHNIPPQGVFSNIAELDFSSVWQSIFSKNFFNAGFETINCSCCSPESVFGENLLPNSKVKAKFLEDGFYFESFSKTFSEKFHSENPFQENRLRQKREFFLKQIPLGPFFKNQFATILLQDALFLEKEGKIEIISAVEKNWFCKKNESFLSTALREFGQNILKIGEMQFSRGNCFFQKTGFEEFYFQSLKGFFSKFSSELVFQASEQNSRFFNPLLAGSIQSVQELVLFKFNKFSEQNFSKNVYFTANKSFIESDSPLMLVKEFARKENLPMPSIKAMHKKMVF